ncbi:MULTISPECIES: hypothetical protein [unclassified Exiguobacterium]|uniref:hypothetical protein n=1 Tax=unclassified Exiguobacterium TaxID=2644629 RepID=UPI001BED12F2|nr:MULTISPECIES: hypothetical protein [unclassified Exiguobacterium]
MTENAKPGRPKTVAGKLTNFNTKLQEDHKRTLEALVKVGPFSSNRDMIEQWTEAYLKDNPDVAEKVAGYKQFMQD